MRKEILHLIEKEQIELIQNLKSSLSTYESTTDLDEDGTIDSDDLSHQADTENLKKSIQQKLKMEEDDLKKMKSLESKTDDKIEEGALVETKDAFYFIGFTFRPINYHHKKILGVSLDAPVFKNNQGKQKGEQLILGDKSVLIENIY